MIRSSLAGLAAVAREPDPVAGRRAAADAWHAHGLILINPAWLATRADRDQLEALAEHCHGKRRQAR